jgi:hypothetical protein
MISFYKEIGRGTVLESPKDGLFRKRLYSEVAALQTLESPWKELFEARRMKEDKLSD